MTEACHGHALFLNSCTKLMLSVYLDLASFCSLDMSHCNGIMVQTFTCFLVLPLLDQHQNSIHL